MTRFSCAPSPAFRLTTEGAYSPCCIAYGCACPCRSLLRLPMRRSNNTQKTNAVEAHVSRAERSADVAEALPHPLQRRKIPRDNCAPAAGMLTYANSLARRSTTIRASRTATWLPRRRSHSRASAGGTLTRTTASGMPPTLY
jgi:hypothetical protein